MTQIKAPILVLAMGNDLLGDDGVALFAARELKKLIPSETIDVIETSEAGLVLMEIMTGYHKAIILDCVQTRQEPYGTIIEFGVEDFRRIVAPSPHYAGLPEVLSMAERLHIPFPKEIKILAIEVVNPFEFKEELSPEVNNALPLFINKTKSIIEQWIHQEQSQCTNIP